METKERINDKHTDHFKKIFKDATTHRGMGSLWKLGPRWLQWLTYKNNFYNNVKVRSWEREWGRRERENWRGRGFEETWRKCVSRYLRVPQKKKEETIKQGGGERENEQKEEGGREKGERERALQKLLETEVHAYSEGERTEGVLRSKFIDSGYTPLANWSGERLETRISRSKTTRRLPIFRISAEEGRN